MEGHRRHQYHDSEKVATGVTCPRVRIHPAILAQAAATSQLLLDGRSVFGVGSGEALNEHILGHRWPPVRHQTRDARATFEFLQAGWLLEGRPDHLLLLESIDETLIDSKRRLARPSRWDSCLSPISAAEKATGVDQLAMDLDPARNLHPPCSEPTPAQSSPEIPRHSQSFPADDRTCVNALTPGYALLTSKSDHRFGEENRMPVDEGQMHDLLFQAYETELGGAQVYEAALACAHNEDLRGEWEHYLDQTRHHVELVEDSLRAFGLDPEQETPGRQVVRHTGEALVKTIALAQGGGTAEQAQVVAAECVTLAETKDHLNWELIGEVVKRLTGDAAKVLRAAHKEVEEQEDEHLYHNSGWARELWIEGLGLPAVLPPPEEQKEVKTAIGAARAKQARQDMT